MKRGLIAVILMLALVSMACSFSVDLPNINTTDTGPTQTVDINEALPEDQGTTMNVFLAMGAGELQIEPGAEGLVEGTIRYNIEDWVPKVNRDGQNLRIEQETIENITLSNDIVNDWNLQLSTEVPMDLEIRAGAYEGTMDFTGLRLRNLEIGDGASKAEVTFNQPNPEEMDQLRYSTGASQVTLSGLSNANFDRMLFESGAGDYTLDFSGDLQRDAEVTIRSGVSQVTIVIPEGVRTRVETEGGLNNVDIDGDWDSGNDTYETAGEGPLLTITVSMGVGNLRLQQR